MKRLNSTEKHQMPSVDMDLHINCVRRLRNAMIALTDLDPHWLTWVERNIPRSSTVEYRMRMVESRARAILLRRHHFFGYESEVGFLIFKDWPFNDKGNLSAD